MYIELSFLFLMYAFSSIALLVSIYALWTLREVQEFYKKKNSITTKKTIYTPPTVISKPKPKGHWD